jgi:type IV pilus assembly protein PilW
MRFSSVVYFVADTGRKSPKGAKINALYRASNNMIDNATAQYTVEELIEGIDNMQLLFGERLPSGDVRYVTADEVNNMLLVESVQIGLLVSGTQDVLHKSDDTFYILPGETIQPKDSSGNLEATVTYETDRRLRREFTQTVNLRNRRLSR